MLALRDHTWTRVVLPVAVFICIIVFLAHRGRFSLHGDKHTREVFVFEYGDNCEALVNSGNWTSKPPLSCPGTPGLATCGHGPRDSWQWSAVALQCGASRQDATALRALLAHRWFVVAGDSIGRFFFAALLRLLSDNPAQQIVFGHRDFEYVLPGSIKATFLWAPYAPNLTAHFKAWDDGLAAPDAFVLSAGLWHMLHISDVQDFAQELVQLKLSATSFLAKAVQAPPVSYCSISEVYPPKLKTEDKREHLTPARVDAYNLAIANNDVLYPSGPFHMLDIHRLTQGCGPDCTHDGLHYSNATYDTAVQVWANTLRSLL
ncbi:hypothetical protein WJX81_003344 [Elliptochloris bilobata]|uniref:SGNH domain-containing protein n=1 Tax=Elliptochloris bilobata TaxID=381761 RepID=A0AAW1QV66_9CHLO